MPSTIAVIKISFMAYCSVLPPPFVVGNRLRSFSDRELPMPGKTIHEISNVWSSLHNEDNVFLTRISQGDEQRVYICLKS